MNAVVIPFLQRLAAAAGDFLRGFLGLHAPSSPPPGASTVELARAELVERAARRPSCC